MTSPQDSASTDPAEAVAFRARALAQAHPLSTSARRYVEAAIADQGLSQPMPEIGMWAGQALLNGYCVRRVEEAEAGMAAADPSADSQSGSVLPVEDLSEAVDHIAGELRAGSARRFLLNDEDQTVETLDRIVASEVDRRLHAMSDSVDDHAWDELSDYLAFWVTKGYALRVAETTDRTAS